MCLIILLCIILTNTFFTESKTSSKDSFNFTPDPEFTIFNITEDENWVYDLNVSCSESLVIYSIKQTNFSSLTINPDTGLINFTPNNDDVGSYDGGTVLLAENRSDNWDYITTMIGFNITNVNDPPNITSYSPASPYSFNENKSQQFNVTAVDPDTKHGDTIYYNWFLDNILQAVTQSWTFSPSLCQAGNYNVTVIVNDTSNEYDSQHWDITVNNVNRPPMFNQSRNISNITWNEDVNLTNNITLLWHFYDEDYLQCNGSNNNTLTFSYIITNGNITVNITGDSVSFYPAPNWQGNASVIFTMNDGTLTAQSNIVNLTVNGTSDPPTLHLENVSWIPNAYYEHQVNATDPDLDYGDYLTFSYNVTNSTMPEFYMNSSGYINFTPITFGNHSINITVIDSYDLNDTKTLLFLVRANNSPLIYSIADQNATEGSLFRINVSGYDVDGDSINFSSNFTAFNYTIFNTTVTTFFFTPNQSHVGNHSILFIINDSFGASNTTIMNLQVLNINNDPVLSSIGSQIAKINKTFTLYVNATDADGDSLYFGDNATFFNITTLDTVTGRALINFSYDGPTGNFSVIINVTDNTSADSEIVNFELTYNRNPLINPISKKNATTGVNFVLNISGSDPDRDSITFTTNLSRISVTKINTTHSMLSFVPIVTNIGLNNISVFADDGDGGSYNTSFLLNVTYVNHAPFFIILQNITCNLNISCRFNITGYDIDGTELNFSVIPNIFNISNVNVTINSTKAQFNFTPWNFSVGNYNLNIIITDGNLTNSTNITIFVNRYPVINWTYPYTNESQGITEGDSITFNITAYDVDLDNLTYFWLMNGTQRGNTSNWTFVSNYTSAGYYNITVIVSDGSLNSSLSWNLTVNNSNRVPEFGVIIKTTESDFSSGNLTRLNITIQSGSIVLNINGSDYYKNGTYISGIIGIPKEYWANVSLTNISWTAIIPTGTNLTVQTRSSFNLSEWPDWSSPYNISEGSQIITYNRRYIQYMVNFSTNDTNVTPVLEEVQIHYIIPNFTGVTGYYYWLDLDDYFSDQDGQTLIYSASSVENIDVLIYEDGEVELRPNPTSWYGIRTIVFNATDGENFAVSNEVTIELTAPLTTPTPSPVPVSTGGGGGSVRTRTTVMNITEQIYLDLIAPGPVKIGPNQTISLPIILRNKGTTTLNGINLDYKINASTNVSVKLKDTYFNQLLPSEQKKTDLIIKSDNLAGSYTITLTAEVQEPYVFDSAIVHIEILDNFTEHINSVRDLLKLHPECLELNEVLIKAEEAIKNYEYTKAGLLLDSATEACRYLISSSGKILELQKATRISEIDTKIVAGVVFIIVMLLLIIYYLAATRNAQKP